MAESKDLSLSFTYNNTKNYYYIDKKYTFVGGKIYFVLNFL